MSIPRNAAASSDIIEAAFMPGNPLRTKFIAGTYLKNPVQFNTVCNMFGYTGTCKGKKIPVMGNGVGIANTGIYSYELYKFYEVENIIRIDNAGAYTDTLGLFDPIFADSAWNKSTFVKTQTDVGGDIQTSSTGLSVEVEVAAARVSRPSTKAGICSSDIFYHEDSVDGHRESFERHGCVCAEMESFALFHNAKILNKHAACLLTINDFLVTHAETTAQERQTSFRDMMLVTLETAAVL